MAVRDKIHNAVKNALIKDGWRITHDPLVVKYGERRIKVDLAAEPLFAAERDGIKIAVEIKSFVGYSLIQDLKEMVGSYDVYLFTLNEVAPIYKLYIAISEEIYAKDFAEPIVQAAVQGRKIPLIIVDIVHEELVQWINR